MKININDDEKITLNDLSFFNKIKFNNNKLNWKILWSNKIDYFEFQLDELKKKYPNIYLISDYFIGLSEIGIAMMNSNITNTNILSHKRINSSMTKKELYDPLNIIVDDENRDYAEYYKNIIFKGARINVIDYIKNNKIKNLKTFFIR